MTHRLNGCSGHSLPRIPENPAHETERPPRARPARAFHSWLAAGRSTSDPAAGREPEGTSEAAALAGVTAGRGSLAGQLLVRPLGQGLTQGVIGPDAAPSAGKDSLPARPADAHGNPAIDDPVERPTAGDADLLAPAGWALEPMVRVLSAPSPATLAASARPEPAPCLMPLDVLLNRLVRRVAWGGDGRRSTVRLEVGAGALEGAVIVVEAVQGDVTVDVDLPPGERAEQWKQRLVRRLNASNVKVSQISVR